MTPTCSRRSIVFFIGVLVVSITIVLPPVMGAEAGQWIKFTGNPILSPTPGAWDSMQVLGPRVLYDGTSYRMWYTGLANGECKPAKVGYAVSSDGIAWTKNPSPVLLPGSTGSWDDESVHAGSVVWNGSLYLMWYGGRCTGQPAVGLATSLDGVTWNKYQGNPVFRQDSLCPMYPYVIRVGTTYKMWYAASCPATTSPFHGIFYATSEDGIRWTTQTSPVLTVSLDSKAWDAGAVYGPTVVYDGSTYGMWYSASDSRQTLYRIGFASSNDGISWNKSPENPVLSQGPLGSWDSYDSVDNQGVLLLGNAIMLYYSADQTDASGKLLSYKIGLAHPPPGFTIPEMPLQTVSLALAITVFAAAPLIRRHTRNNTRL